MPNQMIAIALIVAGTMALGTDQTWAAEAQPTPPTESTDQQPQLAQFQDPKNAPEHSYGVRSSLLPGEEQFEMLEPKEPVTEEEKKALEAQKILVIGFMHLARREFFPALANFEKAAELGSYTGLRNAALLNFRLDNIPKGLKQSRQALERNPQDYQLLHEYGLRSAQINQLDDAIAALEKAAAEPNLKEEDAQRFLNLRHELSELYRLKENYAGQAAALADVLEILNDPEKYPLDPALAAQLAKKKVHLYERLGQTLIAQKKYAEAQKVLEQGRSKEIGGSRLALLLAKALYQQEQYDEALQQINDYLMLQFQDQEAFELYADLLKKLGRENELIDNLAELHAQDKHNPVLKLFYGLKLVDAERYKEAEELLLQVADRPGAMDGLVKVFVNRGDLDLLLKALGEAAFTENQIARGNVEFQIQAIAKDPKLVENLGAAARKRIKDSDNPLPFREKYVMAKIARQAKISPLTNEFFHYCIEERPNALPLRAELIEALFEEERYGDAARECESAMRQSPIYHFVDLLAISLEMEEKTPEAIAALDKFMARNNNPDWTIRALSRTAWVYNHAQQYDKSIAAYEKIIADFPNSEQVSEAEYMLANIYTMKGDTTKAEEMLLKLVDGAENRAIPPRILAAANNDLGYVWADEGKNLDRAEKMIRLAIKLQETLDRPKNAAYLDSLGWVLFKKKQYSQAYEVLAEATSMEEGKDPVIYEHMGEAAAQIGKTDAALSAWEKAIELYKKNDRSRDKEKLEALIKKRQALQESVGGPVDSPVKTPATEGTPAAAKS